MPRYEDLRRFALSLEYPATLCIKEYEPRGYYTTTRFELTPSREVQIDTLRRLADLLKYLYFVESTCDKMRWQLLSLLIHLDAEETNTAGTIGVYVRPPLERWIVTQSKNRQQLSEVEEAMWRVRSAMSEFPQPMSEGPRPYGPVSFRINPEGAFNMDSGNASMWSNSTIPVECHNVDSPFQMLTLLGGLAALHDLAAKDIDRRPPA